MATRSVISVNSDIGIYKHWDGEPKSTLPPIFLYITVFGFIRFKNEIKYIMKTGGCSSFQDYEIILKSEHLSNSVFDEKSNSNYIFDQKYGYKVTSNSIIIYKEGSILKIINYTRKQLCRTIIKGSFENIKNEINNFFKIDKIL